MLRLQDASNLTQVLQKRLVRPVYAHTQGFPYAATLDPSLRNTDGSINVQASGTVTPIGTRTASANLVLGGLHPGLVVVKTSGENVTIACGIASNVEQPMGLLGQFVGGTADDVKNNNEVGIWQGPDSVYDILAPAWNDTGVVTAIGNNAATGTQTLLYAQADGRLGTTKPTNAVAVARIINRVSSSVLRIQLLV